MPFDGSNFDTIRAVTQMLVEGREQVATGWCQGAMRQRGGACMIGSLSVSDYDLFTEAEGVLLDVIRNLGHQHSSIAAFNDDPQRTKEEVMQVYDQAIANSKR